VNHLLRSTCSGILAVATASLLASCKDEGGVLDVFFWARGDGDCERITITIDMQSADALLAPPVEGRDQCDLYKVLENRGCDFEVETIDDGRLLQVTIDDCEIDERSGLFRCAFSDGEIEDIDLHTTAVCDCVDARCDDTPRLCVSSDSEDAACETCNNGVDDDGNGDVDCEDEACSAECVTTTSSTSTSTSNSVGLSTQPTMSTSTSTTFPDSPADRYTATFGIDNGAGIGAIQFDINYASIDAAQRSVRATLSDPDCVSLVPSAFASFQDDEEEETVHASMTNLPGTSGPLELAACTFSVTSEPSAGDLDVEVLQALDLEGDPIGSPPPVEVVDVVPVTTTTTLGAATTTTIILETTTTLDGATTTTTTLANPADYEIVFVLDNASDLVGAIQWSADYSGATGGIEGHGANSSCDVLPDALFAENDKDRVCSGDQDGVCDDDGDCLGNEICSVQLDEVTLGVISIDGLDAPMALVKCTFNGTTLDPPVPGDFDITIEDSTDPQGNLITVALSVTVTPL
jgi:hypothetical protein